MAAMQAIPRRLFIYAKVVRSKMIISPKVATKMLNTIRCNESSRKANSMKYRCAIWGSSVQGFPSFRDTNVYSVEKHPLSLSLATFHGRSKQKLFEASRSGRRCNTIA